MTIPADAELFTIRLEGKNLFYVGTGGQNRTPLTISSSTAKFDVSFFQPFDGLEPSDFNIVTTGTAAAHIASIVNTEQSTGYQKYAVTLDDISGDGTISLQLVDDSHLRDVFRYLPVTVDTTAPQLLSTRFLTGPGDYGNGAQISFQVNFDERIAVNGGTPSLLLSNGAEAVYAGGSGTSALVFTYSVGPNQTVSDDIQIVGYSARGAITTDVAGNAVDWSHLNVEAHDPVSVDPTVVATPHFSSLTIEAGAHGQVAKVGDTITFKLAFEEAITVISHVHSYAPTLMLSNGKTASFTGIADGAMNFSYTVTGADKNGPLSIAYLDMNSITVHTPAHDGFEPAQPLAVTDDNAILRPTSVYVADLNGDGHNDIVTLSRQQNKLSVLLGHGDGTFDSAINYDVGFDENGALERQRAVVIADINRDGIADIATAGVQTVSVMIGNGDGTFAAPVRSPILGGQAQLSNVYKLSTIDLGAGGLRVVVDGAQTYQVDGTDGTHLEDFYNYTSLNAFTSDAQGHLTLDTTMSSVPVAGGRHATLIDVDGDGRLDIVGGSYANETAVDYVYVPPETYTLNDPFTGKPIVVTIETVIEAPGRISITYGLDDVALLSHMPGVSSPWGDGIGAVYQPYDIRILPEVTTSALLGSDLTFVIAAGDHTLSVNGIFTNGTIEGCIYQTIVASPISVKAVDLNGDGALDIVVAGFDDNLNGAASVFYNEGNGHFLGAVNMPIDGFGSHILSPFNRSIDAIAFGDLDGDGKPDMVSIAPDGSPTGVMLYFNHSAPTVPFDYSSLGILFPGTQITINTDPVPFNWHASGDLGAHGGGYQIVAVGDFDDDSDTEVLWRDPTSGALDEWNLLNGNWSSSINPGTHTVSETVAGVGDFNSDGVDDLLWRDPSTGHLDVTIMQHGVMTSTIDLGSHGANWKVLGIGYFDSDGTSDILFQNTTTGAVDLWMMKDGNWSKSISLGSHNTAFTRAVIGDFDGDGTDDVLWQNPTNGAVDLWRMKDGNWAASKDLGSHNTSYELAAAADFNGDGTADVLWRNPTTGQVEGWVMDKGNWFASSPLGTFNTAYTLAGAGNFDHAGGTDVLWHNATTGQVGTWLLGPG